MSWLLDTHVWIWSQLEPERLGAKATRLLEDPGQALYVSTISTLELARLVAHGRVRLSVPVDRWAESALDLLSGNSLELDHTIAAEAYRLPEPFHRDPADRVLVATARRHQLTLLTADDHILKYPHVRTRDARQ
jgi:PIN domain nuclease of toxin-antitoxin system